MTLPLRQDSSPRQHVDKINELIDRHIGDALSVIKDFAAKGDGVTDDSAAIIAAIEGTPSNQTLVFPTGTYLIKSKITALLKRAANIECLGTLKFDGLAECIEFTALSSNIFINRIECINSCGTAVIIKSCMRSNIDIREIAGGSDITTAGIKVVGRYATLNGSGNSLNGCIYNVIRTRTVSVNTSTADAWLVTTEYNTGPGYVNENEFYPQWLDGYNGVRFVKGTGQTDRFNSNKILYAGFENIGNIGLSWEYGIRNVIHSPRFENLGSFEISEDADTYQNTYHLTYSARQSKLDFNGFSARIIGNVKDATGLVIYREAYQDTAGGWIYFNDNYSATLENNTLFYRRSDLGVGYFDKYAFGLKDGSGTIHNAGLIDPIGLQTIVSTSGTITIQDDISFIRVANDGGNISLQMPARKEIDGYNLLLDVYFFSTSYTIEILKSNSGVSVAAGEINGQGLYTLTYRNDSWVVSRIGNPTSATPGAYEGTITWNPASLLDGDSETSLDITVSAAQVNDHVSVFPPHTLSGVKCWGWVGSTGNVKIRLENDSGATVDFPSGVWKVRIDKR